MGWKLAPPLVLSYRPGAVPLTTPTRIVLPRGSTADTLSPWSPRVAVLPSWVQMAPPFVVFSRPVNGPKLVWMLLVLAMPATRVLLVASVGSNCKAEISSAGYWSVRGVQATGLAVMLLVSQMPPLTPPTKTFLTLPGFTAIASMAPVTGLAPPPASAGTFSSCPAVVGAGPSAIQVGTPVRLTLNSVRHSNASNIARRQRVPHDFCVLAAEETSRRAREIEEAA